MTPMQAAIASNELFDGLDAADISALVPMALERSYKAGDIIFHENEEAYAICLLLKGRVGLQFNVGAGRQLVVSTVDAGELFAWSGLVPPHQFTATARAMQDCEVAILRSKDLQEYFDANCECGYKVMQNMASIIARRVRDTRMQLLGLFAG